jgi:two-component system LytT family response regulator
MTLKNPEPAPRPAPILDVMIVDDEPAARRALRECCARETDLRVAGEFGDSDAALAAIRAQPPAVLFLDVQMPTLTGIGLARALDPGTLPQIVFVTAYDRYAIEAFEVCAVDYLLKPFDDERFQLTLARIRRRRDAVSVPRRQVELTYVLEQLERSAKSLREPPPRIIAEAAGRTYVLDAGRVEMIESDRNYVRLTVGRDAYSTRSTLQHAEDSLRSQPLLRVSRSCLVNLNHVREISRTPRGDIIVILAGGATVTSSERFRDSVRKQLRQMQISPRESPAGPETQS